MDDLELDELGNDALKQSEDGIGAPMESGGDLEAGSLTGGGETLTPPSLSSDVGDLMVEPLEADTLAAEPLVAEPMSDNALDGGSLDAAPLGGDTLEAAPLQAGLETPSLETGLPELEPSLDSGLSAEPVAPAVMAAASGSQVGDEENKSRVELKPASQRTGAGIVGYQKIQQLKVKVQAMLGTVPLTVAELANLEQGDLVTLDTKIGDPIEILANGELIARAEIAVTDDPKPRFGLKLTEIVDSNEGQ